MLTKGDRYIKALQAFIEYKWQEYPHFIELLESMTFDELMDKLLQERGCRLYAQKRFEWITRVVDAIDKVYAAAPDDVKQLVLVKYWNKDKTNWAGVAEQIGVSMQKVVPWIPVSPHYDFPQALKKVDYMGIWGLFLLPSYLVMRYNYITRQVAKNGDHQAKRQA